MRPNAPTLNLFAGARNLKRGGGKFEARFVVSCRDFEYKSETLLADAQDSKAPADAVVIPLPPGCVVVDEVRVVFYRRGPLGRTKPDFAFWFHTAFVDGLALVLTKPELDRACKDTKHAKFDRNFAVELAFADVDPAPTPPPSVRGNYQP